MIHVEKICGNNNKVNSALRSEKYWATCTTYIQVQWKCKCSIWSAYETKWKSFIKYGVDNVLTSRFPYYLGLLHYHDLYK